MHKKYCGCKMQPMPKPMPAPTCGCHKPEPMPMSPHCCKPEPMPMPSPCCKPEPMPKGCGCYPEPKPICKVVEKFEYQEVPHVQPIHTHIVTNKVNVHKTYPKYTCSHETKCHDKFC